MSDYLRPISTGMIRAGSIYADDGRRKLVARRLLAYIDEVAARWRGLRRAGPGRLRQASHGARLMGVVRPDTLGER